MLYSPYHVKKNLVKLSVAVLSCYHVRKPSPASPVKERKRNRPRADKGRNSVGECSCFGEVVLLPTIPELVHEPMLSGPWSARRGRRDNLARFVPLRISLNLAAYLSRCNNAIKKRKFSEDRSQPFVWTKEERFRNERRHAALLWHEQTTEHRRIGGCLLPP